MTDTDLTYFMLKLSLHFLAAPLHVRVMAVWDSVGVLLVWFCSDIVKYSTLKTLFFGKNIASS